jgi:hypothetical protein
VCENGFVSAVNEHKTSDVCTVAKVKRQTVPVLN